jgi:hypothetical protein
MHMCHGPRPAHHNTPVQLSRACPVQQIFHVVPRGGINSHPMHISTHSTHAHTPKNSPLSTNNPPPHPSHTPHHTCAAATCLPSSSALILLRRLPPARPAPLAPLSHLLPRAAAAAAAAAVAGSCVASLCGPVSRCLVDSFRCLRGLISHSTHTRGGAACMGQKGRWKVEGGGGPRCRQPAHRKKAHSHTATQPQVLLI